MAIQSTGEPQVIEGGGWKTKTFSLSTGTEGDSESFSEYEQFVARPAERLEEIIGQSVAGWKIHTIIPEAHNYTARGISTAGLVAYHEGQMVAVVTMLKDELGSSS